MYYRTPIWVMSAGTAGGEAAEGEPAADAEEHAADGEQENPDDAADSSADPERSSAAAAPVDYTTKLLQYVAASSGHEFMTKLELRRPKAAEDADTAEGQKPEQTPVTFKILDDHVPLLEVCMGGAATQLVLLLVNSSSWPMRQAQAAVMSCKHVAQLLDECCSRLWSLLHI